MKEERTRMVENEISIELTNLWKSIEEVINAPTKNAAKPLVSRLRFRATKIKTLINDPYLSGKLDEAIGCAEEASGRVKDKMHWESCAKQSWYTFESSIK
jgi:L-serine deaminase